MQHFKTILFITLLLQFFFITFLNAQNTGGPYTSDANTILLMHFDGNLTNSSTLSGNGTTHGSGTSYSLDAPANLEQSFNLDGSSYVTVPHNTNLNLSGDWTIEAWIKITEYNSSTQSIVVRKPGDSDNYNSNYTLELHPWWGNILHGFYFSDTQTRINVTDMSPTLNKWYHVAFIRDASNSEISIIVHDENWDVVSSSARTYSTNNVLLNSQDIRIGESFNGYIDELRISNVVRSFSTQPPPPFPEELDQARMEKKINALNLHRMKFTTSPYSLTIDVLSSSEYEAQKPTNALPFDCGYVNEDGWVYVSEPTTAEQLEVFSDIDQTAIYYMCQSFLQYYYQATEMPIWFKTGFAAYESDMRFDDNNIKTAYNNYGGTLTSFGVLNNPTTFAAKNGLAISYMFGEFMGVYTPWKYYMIQEVNASTIIPVSWWDNVESLDKLFEIWFRYFNVRILEESEQYRIKLGLETEHFKFYYRGAEDFWAAYFSDILEEAITEYIGLYNFDVFEKFSYITMPECDFALISDVDCINRYTGGTAWSSGLSSTSPDNSNDFDRFRRLIRHELGHLTQSHFPSNNMTAWINEGSAQFISHGPLTQAEIDNMQSLTEDDLNQAISYFGHLPTFEDTKIYPGASNVNYYSLGEIMINFVYESGGYSAVKEIIMDHETAITNLGYSSPEDFMTAYYRYIDVRFLKISEPEYFTNYDSFITKLNNLTSSSDSATALNTFWDNLIATGNFPFAIDTKVAFLYRGSATSINWAGEFNGWNMSSDAGNRLGVSDVWLLEMEFLADTRSEYKIVRNGSEWLADPNNPNPLVGDYQNSELWMPDYKQHTELVIRSEISKGTLSDNIRKYSSNLGYTSQYRVYTPADYNSLSNLQTIYVTDGQNYLNDSLGKMVIVLDNLIADGLIEPVIAIFLDPRDPNNLLNDRRGGEYRNNINFVNYVTQDLIPEIDATYKTNTSAESRGIMGASWGGYNASYFCVKASSYFHNIGMNSAYLHPEGDYSIDTDLQATNLDEMKLYLSYGTFDADGKRYFNRLKNIFVQKGKEYGYTIVGDGHTWKNWSRVIGDALEYFYSNTAPAPPVISDIPNQTINEGSSFTTIQLDDFVTDSDNSDSEITWSYNGNIDLTVAISGSRVATITTPSAEWNGSETITFTATDPSGNSDSDEAIFTVTDSSPQPSSLSSNKIISSSHLGYDCQYRVYTPAGYNILSNLPTIYVTDGQNYLRNSMGKMVTTLDDLIANNIIKPVIAIFLDPRDPNNLSNDRRGFEYRNNINFVNYVTQELLPVIDAAYKTNASSDARGIMGASYGGYNAEYFSVKASAYFKLFSMNSPYLHPNDGYNIDADLQAANLDSMKLYLSTGSSDTDGVRYFNRLKGIYDSKGKEFESDIVSNGGHNWSTWSSVVANALFYFFPNSTNPPIVSNIPYQTIFEGNVFTTIQLDNYVTDSDNDDSEITWSFSDNNELTIVVDGNRVATILIPDVNWFGREVITFTATDPSYASSSKDVTFLVIPVNDYPIISDAPELIEFVSDTTFAIDIWELTSDVETSDDSLIYEFSVDSDSILFLYEGGTGILTLSAEISFGGEGNLSWSVSDTEAMAVDTIRISVEKAVIIGVDDEMIIPDEYVLHQNYPNPFNPTTMVKYGIPEQSNIRIEIFNMLGQSVGLLVNGNKSAGYYETTWNASNLPSGLYLISLRAEGLNSKKNFTQVKKALLLK